MSSLAFDPELQSAVRSSGVVAVLVIDRVEDAVPMAEALLAGGVKILELTLRTPAAMGALKAIRAALPEMTVGIGTILNVDQVKESVDAGAAFGVAPGLNPKVVEAALSAGLSFAPGIVTPSDIEAALDFGCRLMKFFPAGPSGGLAYLKTIAAPYVHLGVEYIPLGGLNAGNMGEYLSNPICAAVGGSWIAARPLIQEQQWGKITELASEAMGLVQQARQ